MSLINYYYHEANFVHFFNAMIEIQLREVLALSCLIGVVLIAMIYDYYLIGKYASHFKVYCNIACEFTQSIFMVRLLCMF